MMYSIQVLTIFILACSQWLESSAADISSAQCRGMAAYKLKLQTFWSKEDFPKQYPLYRPPAQWSKLIGRTHSSEYTLWSINKTVSPGVKEFIEKSTTTTTLMDGEVQGAGGVFDVFLAANIKSGVGTTGVTVYVESKHSKISAITLLIPSPDWFIGVSDLDLCGRNGVWIDKHVTDLHPMDAGIDRGLTFSAPKWPENNPVSVTQITSKVPSHPAGSFYYPDMETLKPIGRLTLERVALAEERIVRVEPKQMQYGYQAQVPTYRSASNHDGSQVRTPSRSTDSSRGATEAGEIERINEEVRAMRQQARIDKERRQDLRQQQKQLRKQHKQPENNQHRGNEATEQQQQKVKDKLEEPVQTTNGGTGRANCEVGEWTEWSECSKTCGYGRKTRSRPVLRAPEHGGMPCPLLNEESLCGTMRGCDWKYFSRMNWD